MPAPRDGSWRWAALAALPALVLAAWQNAFVWPFVSDDAFISLRYAARLLDGDGLTWSDGDAVEGYSNLAWVLACAGLGALGVDLVTAARALGAGATALALWALARAGDPADARSATRAAVAPLLAASAQVVLGWTTGGLEGPLVAMWLGFGFGALVRLHARAPVSQWPLRAIVLASVPFALACWTRPDSPLWVAGVAAALVLAAPRGERRPALRRALAFAALPAVAVAAQLAFRVAYHHDVVPNTAHVKAGLDPAAWSAGVDYVGAALAAHAGLAVAALLGALVLAAWRPSRALALLLALPVACWLAYLAAIGGDHFPCRRLLHGALAPLALLAAAPLALGGGAARAAYAAALLACAAWNVLLARTDPQSHELRSETWEWRGREVGLALRAAFGERDPLLAVDAAGAVPFHSGLDCIDMLGLCDRTIATTPVPAWLDTAVPGTPKPPGHLHGNGGYVMDRAPDLMLFMRPPHLPLPVFASAAEFEDDPRFLQGYRCVLVELPDRPIVGRELETLRVPLWVALAGRAGVRREPDRVAIPAFLFGSKQLERPLLRRYQPPPADAATRAADAAHSASWQQWYASRGSVATPDRATGALVLRLADPAAALRCALPAGTWRAVLTPADATARVVATTAGAPAGAGERIVLADGEHELRLERTGGDGAPATLVERVELVRER
jgi:arabinofuranosyltransferase